MNPPRVLLVSCTPPGPDGVGGIFLQDLCIPYHKGLISAFLPVENPQAFSPTLLVADRIPLKLLPIGPVKPRLSSKGTVGKALAWIRNEFDFKSHVSDLLAQAIAFAHQQKPEKIWAVLDAPASVAISQPLAHTLGLPLHTLVWDSPQHIASAFALDRMTRRRFLWQYDEAIRSSERCAVISQPMADCFEQRYQVPCVIVRHGLDTLPCSTPQGSLASDGIFRIGYAGTMNAPCAFAALIRALDSVDWHLGPMPIELVVTGPRLDVRTQRPARVRYYGWLSSVSETVELLGKVDVAYLPQPFTADRQDLARYSFPSKLTTYLAAQKPLLLHAPSYGSLAAYHRDHRLGLFCDSLEPQPILRALQSLFSDPKVYAQVKAWAAMAYERDFTTTRFRSSFAEFIGTDVARAFDKCIRY